MAARRNGDARWFYVGAAAVAALSVPFVFGFGYLAGGVWWGIYAAGAMVLSIAVGAVLYERR